ncbi:MAG: Homoserine kinase [Planctomycetota bacterium]
MFKNIVECVLSKFNINHPYSFSLNSNSNSLSISNVFKVVSPNGVFALKSYGFEGYNSLAFIHTLLDQTHSNGFGLFPSVIFSKDNTSVVNQGGFCWDLSTWLPGNMPDRLNCNLLQSIKSLAQFHLVMGLGYSEYGLMPGMEMRLSAIKSFSVSNINLNSISFIPVINLIDLLKWLKQGLDTLEGSLLPKVKIQYCWGDARRENVLLSNNTISGFVDYYAFRRDCKEVDVARMISSFAGDDLSMWTTALTAYSENFKIDYLVCRKLDIFGTIVSLYRWLNWLQYPMPEARYKQGCQRFVEIFQRVQKWKEHGSLKSMLFYD